MKLGVHSEIGALRRVLVHNPKRALSHLTPSNCQGLLFDDVMHIEHASRHHDEFVSVMQSQGVEVLLLNTLLAETIAVPDAKKWLLRVQVSDRRLGAEFARDVREYLSGMPNEALADILTGGLMYKELPFKSNSMMQPMHGEYDMVIDPLPNHLFTRDTSCWVYGGVSINPMAKPARQRETNHLRAIYRWHPMFAGQDFTTYFGADETLHYDNSTIEGGDVLVIGRGAVLIGMSERTTPQGVEALAKGLFAAGEATRVIAVELPKDRSCMHLDTVFTHVAENVFNSYPAVMTRDTKCWSLYDNGNGGIKVQEEGYFIDAIADALGITGVQVIVPNCDSLQMEREQWNDGANTVALRPGVVVGYKGNDYYNEALDKAGIKVLPIDGAELGRGRGGSRCMTCPIIRDGI